MTLVLTILLTSLIGLILKFLARVTKSQGQRRFQMQEVFYRVLGETFGNFKLVKLLGHEDLQFNRFSQASWGFVKAHIYSNTLSMMPRGILETMGFSILIGAVIYILYRYQDATQVIPIISLYALGLYRMLPGLNRILGYYNEIIFRIKSLDWVYHDLSQPVEVEGEASIVFDQYIRLENVSFSYEATNWVLKDINLKINKGEHIGFYGESGSGKSTLVDLIIGIYRPTVGSIYVDQQKLGSHNIRSWRAKVGYIPQTIYLFDGTVAENVAFGSMIDQERVIEVLKKANIWDFLQTKQGINTRVGEGGIQLSGGQRQRIGIARALYLDPEILVLDEATSALDYETEVKIMKEIYAISQDKTLLVIAHRMSTLEHCHRRIKIHQGQIVDHSSLDSESLEGCVSSSYK